MSSEFSRIFTQGVFKDESSIVQLQTEKEHVFQIGFQSFAAELANSSFHRHGKMVVSMIIEINFSPWQ